MVMPNMLLQSLIFLMRLEVLLDIWMRLSVNLSALLVSALALHPVFLMPPSASTAIRILRLRRSIGINVSLLAIHTAGLSWSSKDVHVLEVAVFLGDQRLTCLQRHVLLNDLEECGLSVLSCSTCGLCFFSSTRQVHSGLRWSRPPPPPE
ncbi:unnamed protein product [Prorocentrum cordatum]|uniref:Secreted protein n=1 Tax=Prorocentrum cordatum TaxID=2364126 RepID=A0ABN9WAC1_9DINO|nr:unnamed protein product [Polarella glacialis]